MLCTLSWLHTFMTRLSHLCGYLKTSAANPSRPVFSGRHVSCWSARWQRAVGFGSQSTRWRQAGSLGLGSHPWHGQEYQESSIFWTRFAVWQFLFFFLNNYCMLHTMIYRCQYHIYIYPHFHFGLTLTCLSPSRYVTCVCVLFLASLLAQNRKVRLRTLNVWAWRRWLFSIHGRC